VNGTEGHLRVTSESSCSAFFQRLLRLFRETNADSQGWTWSNSKKKKMHKTKKKGLKCLVLYFVSELIEEQLTCRVKCSCLHLCIEWQQGRKGAGHTPCQS
jgi:hypothetical protein